jgi:hypothetical protein
MPSTGGGVHPIAYDDPDYGLWCGASEEFVMRIRQFNHPLNDLVLRY